MGFLEVRLGGAGTAAETPGELGLRGQVFALYWYWNSLNFLWFKIIISVNTGKSKTYSVLAPASSIGFQFLSFLKKLIPLIVMHMV